MADTGRIATLATVFTDAATTVRATLAAAKGAPAAVESATVIGSGAAAAQYSDAYRQWTAAIAQLATSLATMDRKLHLTAAVYSQGESDATVRPAG